MGKRILILRGGALGDFLLTLPALELLRGRWPDCQLTLVGNATAAALALAGGELDEAYSQHEARWAPLYGTAPLPAPLLTWLQAFDLILCFWPDPEEELRRRFPLRPDQEFIQAAARPLTHPAARHFCEALAPLGIRCPATFEHSLKAYACRTRHAGAPTIGLHPGSSSATRNWPAEHWLRLGEQLQGAGLRLLLITGEADQIQREALAPLQCEQARELSLPQLASRLAACDFYIGHDTGVSHLAAALGLPALILFGPSDPRIWAPQGPGIRVLQAASTLAELEPARVLSTLREHPCFPAP